jgi:protein-tyrosine phosphatase
VQEKEWLALYDKQVLEYELRPVGKHPKDQPRGQELTNLLRDRELVEKQPRAIVVHCTHGYNRSGYCIVHCAKRGNPLLSVTDCIRQ